MYLVLWGNQSWYFPHHPSQWWPYHTQPSELTFMTIRVWVSYMVISRQLCNICYHLEWIEAVTNCTTWPINSLGFNECHMLDGLFSLLLAESDLPHSACKLHFGTLLCSKWWISIQSVHSLFILLPTMWIHVMLCDPMWCSVTPCDAVWPLVMLCGPMWCCVTQPHVMLCDPMWCCVCSLLSPCRNVDLLCSVKYNNNLPDIPFDPKFLTYPFDSQRSADHYQLTNGHLRFFFLLFWVISCKLSECRVYC